MRRRFLLLFLACLAPVAPIAAQASNAALDRAIAAYRDLDLDAAAAQLTALTADSSTTLSPELHKRALMYLGATELLRDRTAAADAAFRRIVLLDPAYRPDALTFPPEVTTRFAAARRGVRAVAVSTPDSVDLAATRDAFVVRLDATSPHDVRVMIVDRTGTPVRLLHDGGLADTISLRWSGRDASGRFQPSGSYRLEVTSFTAEDRATAARVVVVPLRLDRLEPDTLALPAAPRFTPRPETRPGSPSWRPLVVGLAGVAAVAALPAVAGDGATGVPARFAVAGGFAVGGVAGVVLSRRARPIPENVAWNAEQRAAYERELARMHAANDARRAAIRLRIVAAPQYVEDRR